MPLRMDEGWNQIQFNLADFTRRAYGTNYVETLRVQVHANCRLRRIYFSDRLYSEEELPPEFKLYLPMQQVLALVFLVKFFGFSTSSISVRSYANNVSTAEDMTECKRGGSNCWSKPDEIFVFFEYQKVPILLDLVPMPMGQII